MADRRTTPATARIAHESLRGQVDLPLTVGEAASIGSTMADLCAAPDGPRDRQLRYGAQVTVIERLGAWAFIWARAENYCGWVLETCLAAPVQPTHWLATPSHLYPEAGFKARERQALPLGGLVEVLETTGKFARTSAGFIPLQHLRACADRPTDPVAEAEKLLGTPYLWGGDGATGIDCSGLTHLAHALCDLPCPADSDQQRAGFGQPCEAPFQRGDLLFWPGHVAMVVDETRIIHANSTFMCVMYEGLAAAMARIEAQGDGPFLAARRLR